MKYVACFVFCTLALVCRATEVDLPTSAFDGIHPNYELRLAKKSRVQPIQTVDVEPKITHRGYDIVIRYPAAELLRNGRPGSPSFEVESINVELGGHTSYLRPVYSIRVTIAAANGAHLYAIATFAGSWSRNYLSTPEAKNALCDALGECMSRLRPDN